MSSLNVGVNIVSCLRLGLSGLFRATLFDPQVAIDLAIQANMDFLQILPLRGMTKMIPPNIPCYLCEDAWNAGTFLTWLTRAKGSSGSPMNLHDWGLFPSPSRCEAMVDSWVKGGSRLIQHELGGDNLVELYPGLDKTPEELLKLLLASNQRLVVDSFHLIRNYRSDEIAADPKRIADTSPLGANAQQRFESMKIMAPVLAPVFHLNLRGPWPPPIPPYHILHQWFGLTSQYQKRWVVIEVEPNLRWPKQRMVEFLASTREAALNTFKHSPSGNQ